MALPLKLGLVKYCRPENGEKFQVPCWAQLPSAGAALHVTKDGVTMSTLKLDGEYKYYMFGRAPSTCSDGKGFAINNPTLSRQHAVIVHGGDSALYLIDLQSSCGTTVNGEHVEPYYPRLLENRNIIRFGQSTRRYLVRIFPKEDSLLMQANDQVLHTMNLTGTQGDSKMNDDDDDDDDEDEESDRIASPASRNENARRRFSLNQARIFTGLNSCVSYPSPKSVLGSQAADQNAVMNISPDRFAEVMAASHSPAPSPHHQAKRVACPEKHELFNSIVLPGPADSSLKSSRSRSMSLSLSPQLIPLLKPIVQQESEQSQKMEEDDAGTVENSPNRTSTPRSRSYSTCATIRKRPASNELYSKDVVRRRSVTERRVSFCSSLEFISINKSESTSKAERRSSDLLRTHQSPELESFPTPCLKPLPKKDGPATPRSTPTVIDLFNASRCRRKFIGEMSPSSCKT